MASSDRPGDEFLARHVVDLLGVHGPVAEAVAERAQAGVVCVRYRVRARVLRAGEALGGLAQASFAPPGPGRPDPGVVAIAVVERAVAVVVDLQGRLDVLTHLRLGHGRHRSSG